MPESAEVEGIADGRAEDGSFVRTFWFWAPEAPSFVHVRARICGADYASDVPVRLAESWLDGAHEHADIPIAGQKVTIPTWHVDAILLAIDHQIRELRKL